MNEVIIGLGSNIGDRKKYLREAIHTLSQEIFEIKASSIYQSPPWGYESDLDYYNMVIVGETELGPKQMLSYLHQVEEAMGRSREKDAPRYVNRIIDLDLLHFSDMVLVQEDIEVPHPRMWERAFVMLPLLEVKPSYQWKGKEELIKIWKENGGNATDCTKL